MSDPNRYDFVSAMRTIVRASDELMCWAQQIRMEDRWTCWNPEDVGNLALVYMSIPQLEEDLKVTANHFRDAVEFYDRHYVRESTDPKKLAGSAHPA